MYCCTGLDVQVVNIHIRLNKKKCSNYEYVHPYENNMIDIFQIKVSNFN